MELTWMQVPGEKLLEPVVNMVIILAHTCKTSGFMRGGSLTLSGDPGVGKLTVEIPLGTL